MILAAAAAAAAGISYLFHDDDDDEQTKTNPNSNVTVSSTIVDQQGVVKTVIYPYPMMFYHPYFPRPDRTIVTFIAQSRSNFLLIPRENRFQLIDRKFFRQLSLIFFWSIPLKSRRIQLSTRSMMTTTPSYERHSIKMSIGIPHETDEHLDGSRLKYYCPSEIALSHTNDRHDDTLDSLSYNPMNNDHIIPIGILKKNRSNDDDRSIKMKRIRSDFDQKFNVTWTDNEQLRNLLLNNVNICVENLSKLLSQTCSNSLSSIGDCDQECSHSLGLNDSSEKFADGIILHRGHNFGRSLGEPLIRQDESHSIENLNRLLSSRTCALMRGQGINTIEDFIRFYLIRGEDDFREEMRTFYAVRPRIIEQLIAILNNWNETLT